MTTHALTDATPIKAPLMHRTAHALRDGLPVLGLVWLFEQLLSSISAMAGAWGLHPTLPSALGTDAVSLIADRFSYWPQLGQATVGLWGLPVLLGWALGPWLLQAWFAVMGGGRVRASLWAASARFLPAWVVQLAGLLAAALPSALVVGIGMGILRAVDGPEQVVLRADIRLGMIISAALATVPGLVWLDLAQGRLAEGATIGRALLSGLRDLRVWLVLVRLGAVALGLLVAVLAYATAVALHSDTASLAVGLFATGVTLLASLVTVCVRGLWLALVWGRLSQG